MAYYCRMFLDGFVAFRREVGIFVPRGWPLRWTGGVASPVPACFDDVTLTFPPQSGALTLRAHGRSGSRSRPGRRPWTTPADFHGLWYHNLTYALVLVVLFVPRPTAHGIARVSERLDHQSRCTVHASATHAHVHTNTKNDSPQMTRSQSPLVAHSSNRPDPSGT